MTYQRSVTTRAVAAPVCRKQAVGCSTHLSRACVSAAGYLLAPGHLPTVKPTDSATVEQESSRLRLLEALGGRASRGGEAQATRKSLGALRCGLCRSRAGSPWRCNPCKRSQRRMQAILAGGPSASTIQSVKTQNPNPTHACRANEDARSRCVRVTARRSSLPNFKKTAWAARCHLGAQQASWLSSTAPRQRCIRLYVWLLITADDHGWLKAHLVQPLALSSTQALQSAIRHLDHVAGGNQALHVHYGSLRM